jgi:hypothetical protein
MKQNSDLPLDAALFRLSPCCSASTLPARFHFGSSCFRLHFDAAELLRWRAGGWMRLRDAPTQLRGWRLEAGGGDTTCTGPIHLYWAATGAAAQAAPVVDPPLPTLFLRVVNPMTRPHPFLHMLPSCMVIVFHPCAEEGKEKEGHGGEGSTTVLSRSPSSSRSFSGHWK